MNIISVELDSQPIELCKLLKIANLVGGGGEAKIVISEGYVAVNGEIEFQKRKKIYHQDVVEFNGDVIEVSCLTPVETASKPQKQVDMPAKPKYNAARQAKASKTNSNTNKAPKQLEDAPVKGRRRKISF